MQKQIFCTEPYRIPFAGKINICCFDKTGTLTQNDLVIKGFLGVGNTDAERATLTDLENVQNKDKNATIAIAGAHTLAHADGNLIGDPIEKQCFEGMKLTQAQDGSRNSSGRGFQVTQIKKYVFSSTLKRMSVLAAVKDNNGSNLRVLSKGAPEVLKKYMKKYPDNYDSTYLQYTKNGSRVLAVAYKDVPRMTPVE